MTEDEEREVLARMLKAVDECKRGVITRDELRRRLYEEAARQEQEQWRIVEDLRTNAPEDQRELAQAVANLLEGELRKGHGHA
jgi:Asp-tRNA(Asn)/Glu-tRNA(Gln) amidotransferase B subunit